MNIFSRIRFTKASTFTVPNLIAKSDPIIFLLDWSLIYWEALQIDETISLPYKYIYDFHQCRHNTTLMKFLRRILNKAVIVLPWCQTALCTVTIYDLDKTVCCGPFQSKCYKLCIEPNFQHDNVHFILIFLKQHFFLFFSPQFSCKLLICNYIYSQLLTFGYQFKQDSFLYIVHVYQRREWNWDIYFLIL